MLPTEAKVESGTSQSKCGTSVNLSNSGIWQSSRSQTQSGEHPLDAHTRVAAPSGIRVCVCVCVCV